MDYLDLFSGIGGFAYGAWLAGMKFENHLASEIDPYCQKLYSLRFPDSIQLGDITKINCGEIKAKHGEEWIITGGFPCQDISCAGKGAGIHGARSGLWFEYRRIIDGLRPRFAIMENVGALVSRGLDSVLGSLAEIGYDAEWQDIRASDVGAPHRRERIWIVAYPTESRFNWRQRKEQHIQRSSSQAPRFMHSGYVADSEEIGRRKRNQVDGGSQERTGAEGKRRRFANGREDATDTFRAGLEKRNRRGSRGTFSSTFIRDWWATEPAVGRVAHGVRGRVDRLKGLGNSIVPQIAQILFEQTKPLIEADHKSKEGE
jgi:DNA (cytosine-5)-methyltransferase 1